MGKAPAVQTADAFFEVLQKSRLLTEEQLAEVKEATAGQQDSRAVARYLLKQQLLTRWQATQLLSGYHALIIGKYKLCDAIGRGELGRVFLAQHGQLGRRVALKTLPRQHTQQAKVLERFLGEARKIADLDHRNIIHIYDIDAEDGRYFLVTEYAEGQDLQSYVDKAGPLPFATSADIIRQAADGLSFLHERGLTHQDLKPANIVLNDEDVVKLLDVGVGRLRDAVLGEQVSSSQETAIGPRYLSPEQLGGHAADGRSDLFSLGCVFYWLLTGTPPYPRATTPFGSVAPLAEVRPDTPPELIELCEGLMQLKPEDRKITAAKVAKRLAKWNTAQSAETSPESNEQVDPKVEDTQKLNADTQSLDALAGLPGDNGADNGPEGGFAIATKKRRVGGKKKKKKAAPAPAPSTDRESPSPASGADRNSNKKLLIILGAGAAAAVVVVMAVIAFIVWGNSGGGDEVAQADGQPEQQATSVETETNNGAGDIGDPDIGDPDIGDPDIGDPDIGDPGVGDPGVGDPGVGNPGVGNPGAGATPPMANDSTNNPNAKTPGTADATASNPATPAATADAAGDSGGATEPVSAAGADGTSAKANPPATDTKQPTAKPPAKPPAKPKPMGGKAKTTAKPKDPLSGIPKLTDLPALFGPEGGPHPDAFKRKALGTIMLPEKVICSIYMRGGDGAARGRKVFSIRNAEGGLAERAWEIRLEGSEIGGENVVANLKIEDDNKLYFQWAQDAVKDPVSAHLINCMLNINLTVGGATKDLGLRRPVVVEPITVDMDRTGSKVRWEIPTPPDPDKVYIEIVGTPPPFPKSVLEPEKPVLADKSTQLVRVGEKEEDQVLVLKVDTSMKRNVEVNVTAWAQFNKAAKMERLNKASLKKMADAAEAGTKTAGFKVAQLARIKPGKDRAQNQQLEQAKNLANQEMATWTEVNGKMEKLKRHYEQLNGQGKLKIRMFYQTEAGEVTLLRTQ